MNVLILHAHDAGCHCSPYGYAACTPNLQRLAVSGVTFRHMHAAAPTCSPSRAALWTGRTAHETGLLGLVHRGFDLNDRSQHLARHLAENGFRTALAGIQHECKEEHPEPVYQELLCERNLPDPERDADTADQAISFLERRLTDTPWMLSVGFFLPHRPFIPSPDPQRAHHVRVPEILPDSPVVRQDYADYLASVEFLDTCCGRILDALEATGQATNTLVIFTTDHGIAFPDMKCSLTRHGTGIAMLLRVPGGSANGCVVDALASNMDVVPTVCDYLGVPAPTGIHGKSLRPVLEGKQEEVHETLFAEINFHASAEPMRAVRTHHHNLVVRFDDDLRRPLANVDGSPSKEAWIKDGAGSQPLVPVSLYDLKLDPMERVNVADDPRYLSVRKALEQQLNDWMKKTNDPLLRGPLRRPPGARIHARTAVDSFTGELEQDAE